ncbi:DUF3466 family protein [Vibrio sp. 99-70-13A1]|uniref:DUF3466 family protein n=1 Tax=Vibrio sp. 99-70-13A1 TaxID=2607601 RepID=UPI001493ACC3|nr:DUF3466 family protein [Vibrio sp. 99-70-13A1]NOH96256.1 DUF3466 family protein [Vibrio sp. 99-70-13A1]
MSCTKFKLTTVAALVLAATQASAALYDVVEVTPTGLTTEATEYFGVAVIPQDIDKSTATPDELLGCFGSTACSESTYPIAVESRVSIEGVSYREEVPFAMDNRFYYLEDYDNFEDYCVGLLEYSTCEGWSTQRWNTWQLEQDMSYVNAEAFIEGKGKVGTYNTVINSIDELSQPVGVQSDGSNIRNNAITTAPVTTTTESRAWDSVTVDGKLFNVGSISTDVTNDYGNYFSSKAAIWNSDSTTPVLSEWGTSVVEIRGDYIAQGSMRAITYDSASGKLYGAGYNANYDSNDLQDMNASVFVIDTALTSIEPLTISGPQVDSNGDYKYTNSVATDINSNLLVVGHAKRRIAEEGTLDNKIFVSQVTSSNNSASLPTGTFLTGGIFFSGAGGNARSVNNFNEIVGQIDAESSREVDGKERRHRGFIYPYATTGTESTRSTIFKDQAWWLDDLTNDGDVAGNNNKYRIFDATDINDAGVISATAFKCTVNGAEQAYDTTSHNAECQFGSGGVEEIVAVKLIPRSGAVADDIIARSTDAAKVERSGAGFGLLSISLLGFLAFRRKFK